MIQQDELEKYIAIQNITKELIKQIKTFICEGVSEADIRRRCEQFLQDRGADFWWHNVGAYILVGNRTVLSIPGKQYTFEDLRVKHEDLVTVDLAPSINNYWGDFARSFIVSDGRVIDQLPTDASEQVKALFEGVEFEEKLHQELLRIARPDMTFEELYFHMNKFITEQGFENLDYHRNLGHSIVKHIDDRIYIEKRNTTKLGDVQLFTFEPHTKKKGGKWGFKKEDIYYFYENELKVL